MLDQGYITEAEYQKAINEELKFAESNKRTAENASNQPYFIDQVVKDVKGILWHRVIRKKWP